VRAELQDQHRYDHLCKILSSHVVRRIGSLPPSRGKARNALARRTSPFLIGVIIINALPNSFRAKVQPPQNFPRHTSSRRRTTGSGLLHSRSAKRHAAPVSGAARFKRHLRLRRSSSGAASRVRFTYGLPAPRAVLAAAAPRSARAATSAFPSAGGLVSKGDGIAFHVDGHDLHRSSSG